MNTNPLAKGLIEENGVGTGPVTDERVAERGRELARIAGRPPREDDYDQAKRELTGGPEETPQESLLESFPDGQPSEDPMPDSTGRKVPESESEDEDADGRSESAQMVEEGVNEAEHDQMLQAAKAADRKDRLEG